MQELHQQYAKEILKGDIDPFELSFSEYEKQKQKEETILAFEELGDDISTVKRYLIQEDEEALVDDLSDAKSCEAYLDVAESILFEELDPDMAKIVINKALSVAKNSSDYVAVAELFLEEFQDKNKAKEAYNKAVALAQTTVAMLEVADSVVDEEYLNDQEWALELYHQAASLAKQFEDFIYVARSLSPVDQQGAKEILDIAYGIVDRSDLHQLVTLGFSYSSYLNEKEISQEIFVQALSNAKEFEAFFYILNYIAKAKISKEFFKRVMRITILSMTEVSQKEKVASLVLEYLQDEKLSSFIKNNSAEDVIAFFAKKNIEDLKFTYAQQILEGGIDPKEIPFEQFVKQQ